MTSQIMNEAVNVILNRLFRQWDVKKQKDRTGLHASGIIAAAETFCFREHVLRYFYKTIPASNPWQRLLRIFLEGWYVHKKWQYLFKMGEIAESIERAHVSKFWDFYFTPDATITILNKKIVVEIKSHSMNGFDTLKSAPSDAVKQANIYMHFAGIPWALILVENKNNQEFKIWMLDYDPQALVPYLERILYLKKLFLIFARDGRLPRKHDRCDFEGKSNPRARTCEMCKVCFGSTEFREEFRRNNL